MLGHALNAQPEKALRAAGLVYPSIIFLIFEYTADLFRFFRI